MTFATPPQQQVSFAANNNNDSRTLSSMSASASDQSPKKKIKSTRTTASAKQTHQTAIKEKNKWNKKAFKHARIWYAREKSTKGGMLAVCIVSHANKEFNMSLSARSVQRFFQEGEIGSSPKRRGPKSNIPECH